MVLKGQLKVLLSMFSSLLLIFTQNNLCLDATAVDILPYLPFSFLSPTLLTLKHVKVNCRHGHRMLQIFTRKEACPEIMLDTSRPTPSPSLLARLEISASSYYSQVTDHCKAYQPKQNCLITLMGPVGQEFAQGAMGITFLCSLLSGCHPGGR